MVLSGYRIKKYETEAPPPTDSTVREPSPLQPLVSGGDIKGYPSNLDYLRKIIQKMSATFGDIAPEDDIVQFVNHLFSRTTAAG